jgi:hypothetical protein
MTEQEVRNTLKFFFPKSFEDNAPFLQRPEAKLIIERIKESPRQPINRTQANQLLHLCHEAGMSDGFFRYYFLTEPKSHPYPVNRVVEGPMPGLSGDAVWTLAQFDWGLRRLHLDALLYWGDIRSAYRELRSKTYRELKTFFGSKRVDTEAMGRRGEHYPFEDIADGDRYLISEIACKAYAPDATSGIPPIETYLLEAFASGGLKETTIGQLVATPGTVDPQTSLMLKLGATELMQTTVRCEDEIRAALNGIRQRFEEARKRAISNTHRYLSLVSELDVYVATSMREREQFLDLARMCRSIFETNDLKKLNIRYFDPTMSAAEGHEDKGLIECLMVKCSKATLYFAGESDSFGKDAEVAMSMSLGKPVVILCPDTEAGRRREKLFRDIHPLSRLINFETGVVNGALVTRSPQVAGQLLERIFENRMEYDLDQKGDGYFRLRERLTKSVVRLQTNDRLLLETFWNYYHGIS